MWLPGNLNEGKRSAALIICKRSVTMTVNETQLPLPLSGIKVLELGHAILGPSCGLVLADMGADVIHVERAPEGDYTRNLPGMGSGFHSYFNRNKRSLVLDLKSDQGKDLLKKLIASAVCPALTNIAPAWTIWFK